MKNAKQPQEQLSNLSQELDHLTDQANQIQRPEDFLSIRQDLLGLRDHSLQENPTAEDNRDAEVILTYVRQKIADVLEDEEREGYINQNLVDTNPRAVVYWKALLLPEPEQEMLKHEFLSAFEQLLPERMANLQSPGSESYKLVTGYVWAELLTQDPHGRIDYPSLEQLLMRGGLSPAYARICLDGMQLLLKDPQQVESVFAFAHDAEQEAVRELARDIPSVPAAVIQELYREALGQILDEDETVTILKDAGVPEEAMDTCIHQLREMYGAQ